MSIILAAVNNDITLFLGRYASRVVRYCYSCRLIETGMKL